MLGLRLRLIHDEHLDARINLKNFRHGEISRGALGCIRETSATREMNGSRFEEMCRLVIPRILKSVNSYKY